MSCTVDGPLYPLLDSFKWYWIPCILAGIIFFLNWSIFLFSRGSKFYHHKEFFDKDPKYGKQSMKRSQNKRLSSNLPPPFPNGWFCLCFSQDLKQKDVKQIRAFGIDMVLFRGTDNVAYAIDAYCPHLGANLAVGGTIVHDRCIRCPFHSWTFDGKTGNCVSVPYKCTDPANVTTEAELELDGVHGTTKTKKYDLVEQSGMILFWHCPQAKEGESTVPQFPAPIVAELNNQPSIFDKYLWYFTTQHTVSCHIQEIPENGADASHLICLHRPFVIDNWLVRLFLTHCWTSSWNVDERLGDDVRCACDDKDDCHCPIRNYSSDIEIHQSMLLFGRWKIPGVSVDVDIHQIGPGVVILRIHSAFGTVLMLETVLPVKPMLQLVSHSVHAGRFVPAFIPKLFLAASMVQFERDVPIWSNKTYIHNFKPILSDNKSKFPMDDRGIPRFRKWFQKSFYCKCSVPMKDALENERDSMITLSDW